MGTSGHGSPARRLTLNEPGIKCAVGWTIGLKSKRTGARLDVKTYRASRICGRAGEGTLDYFDAGNTAADASLGALGNRPDHRRALRAALVSALLSAVRQQPLFDSCQRIGGRPRTGFYPANSPLDPPHHADAVGGGDQVRRGHRGNARGHDRADAGVAGADVPDAAAMV